MNCYKQKEDGLLLKKVAKMPNFKDTMTFTLILQICYLSALSRLSDTN